MDNPELQPWPNIPEAELVKGHTITAERLRELGVISGDHTGQKWQFRLMEAVRVLMQKYKISVRMVNGGLRVHTDGEAAEYHDRRAHNKMDGLFGQVRMLSTVVDPSKLSSAEQEKHTRSLTSWGFRAKALKSAIKSEDVKQIS